MKTRNALNVLSKGAIDSDSISSELSDRKAKYLAEYDAIDKAAMDKRAELSVQLPFAKVLHRKISKVVDSADNKMPVVTRFDLYQGVRKIAERTQNDSGLVRATKMLENGWHEDPMGSLTYNDVRGLVATLKDQFPRSKAADAIEAECTRVGFHKLPVAKLARIASKIESQSDYDSLMDVNGFSGDRPEQIRARALVRGLVSMRTDVDAHLPAKADTRSASERIAGKIAQLDMEPDNLEDIHDEPATSLPPLDMKDESPLPMHDEPMNGEISEEEIASGMDVMDEIQDVAQDIVDDAPPEAQDFIEHEMAEGHSGYPGTAEWGAEEILNEDHSAPPPSDQWLEEELAEIMAEQAPSSHMASKKRAQMDDEDFEVESEEQPKSRGKGIPMPPTPKSQPKVTTYGKKPVSLTASKIEDDLLSGKKVAIAGVSIVINSNDEVELWNKSAGVATDLGNLDRAIIDFIKAVNAEQKKQADRKIAFKYDLTQLVNVPCDMCGDVTVFEKAASADDEYGCACGHLISASSVDELHKVAQWGKVYRVDVQYPVRKDQPEFNKQARAFIAKTLGDLTRHDMQVIDDSPGLFSIHTSSQNFDPEKAEQFLNQAGGLQANGGSVSIKRVAQGVPPMPSMTQGAPAMPSQNTPDIDDSVPASEAIAAALTHYKSTGTASGPADAIAHMLKDYKEREDLRTPENQAMAISIAMDLWGGGQQPAAPAAVAPPPQPTMNTMASKVTAQSKMKTPSVRKPKDHVSVPKDLGKDSETQDLLPSPGSVKQQHKPTNKMSPKDLGKDSETKDLLPTPGNINEHPNRPSGNLPDTNLGEDTEPNDPFNTPSLGASPRGISKE